MSNLNDPEKKQPQNAPGHMDGDGHGDESKDSTTPLDSPPPRDPQATLQLTPEELAEITKESFPTDPDDPLVGTLLRNKWRVLSRIGAGSFGTVYKVQDEDGGWIEALKILSIDRLRGPEAETTRKRFLREARIMKRLGSLSPHIVGLSTYEDDTEAGLVYFLMEYVDGRVLSDVLLEDGPLSIERTIRIGLQVCDALIAAHEGEEAVVHRDLKLENVMLTTDRDGAESAKVLDFGIAKIAEQDADSRLTQAGTLGTPGYAAPEQLRAENVDGRTDLFAFGVILYSLVTGKNPWLGHLAHQPTNQTYELMAASDRAVVLPISESGVDVPPGMVDIIMKLLKRDPDDRYQSARELSEALYALGGGEISSGRLGLTKELKAPKVSATPDNKAERRLAAVWFADLVGYSTLSSQDEETALALLGIFHATARRVIESGGGRVVQFIGDAVFAEFSSTQRAVRTAKDFMEAFAKDTSESQVTPQLRIGIHVGDVLVAADGDLFGDGVNVAARIQTEAEPGQILVSQDVWRQLKQRRDFGFMAVGERSLKGIGAPVSLFVVVEAGELTTTGDLKGLRRDSTTGLPVYPGARPPRSRAKVGAAALVVLLAVGGGAYVAVEMAGVSSEPAGVTTPPAENAGASGDAGVGIVDGGQGTPAQGDEVGPSEGGETTERGGDESGSGAPSADGDGAGPGGSPALGDSADPLPPAAVASVRIEGLPDQQFWPGTTVTLSATPLDGQLASLAGFTATWRSGSQTVARITANGTLTAVTPGSTVIIASVQGVDARATVTVVLEPVASVSLTPSSLSLPVGEAGIIAAAPLGRSGSPLQGRPVNWTTDNRAVARVTQTGEITAEGPGQATITAVFEGASASAIVTVEPPPIDTRTAIDELIANYARALESRDVAQVRRAYPNISSEQADGLAITFQLMEELQTDLRVVSVDETGNEATAEVTGTWTFNNTASRRQDKLPQVMRATFERGPNGWILVLVQNR